MSDPGIEALRNLRVLVVEDEPLVIMALADELERAGARIAGLAVSVDEALLLVTSRGAEAAILDVELRTGWVFPVADLLLARGTPFVFATAHDAARLPERFAGIPLCPKPQPPAEVIGALARLIAGGVP